MRLILLVIFALILSFPSISQETEAKDPYKFIANFDMRNSVIIQQAVRFNGLKLGLGNSKQRFGIGFYGLRESVITTNFKVDSLDATDTNKYDFGFLSFYYERILYQSKRWEFSAPIHLNIGSLQGYYLNTNNRFRKFLDKPVSSFTISVKSHFRVFRWIGFHGGVGYNFILGGDQRTNRALNAPFYSFGFKIFLGEAWKLTFNKEYRKSPWID